MNFCTSTFVLMMKVTLLISISNGLYIKTIADNQNKKTLSANNDENNEIEWSVFQEKLGLTNQKIELLKSQKDQKGTLELLNRFIEANPNYNVNKPKKEDTDKESSSDFWKLYHNLLKQLKLSHRTLKTSLNFEFADKPQKSLKRSRRKIAVKMVSDMPTEKIDELLKIFNERYGINKQDDGDDDVAEADDDYKEIPLSLPTTHDPDYVYENLYEDEEDLAAPAKSNHDLHYGSFQDLILQASRNQWQRQINETKLRNRNNENFI